MVILCGYNKFLINLVSNAIKFTEKGNVTLQVNAKETDKQNIEIEFIITDTGIGIPKDKIDKIFERYEQASATIKNTFGGTGLGLSISKKIIELMNGNIQLRSKLNKGTQFIVRVPFKTKKHQTIEKQITEINYQILKNKTIIIADDNEENRLVAKEILLSVNKSIAIYEAENGQQVLSILEKNKADILFIDMDMPVLNGIETVEKVRNNKKLSHLKIIGNTASLSTFSNEDLISLGFDDFIYKPYKVENLIYIIQEVLIKKG
jgi:CheY-like chemotaxis protein/anti-sigma regulatory factor (Ser/Thr protein kinase)